MMKNTLIFFIGCLISITLTAQADGFIKDMSKKWQNARDYTLELAELMPEEAYTFKPTEDQLSFHDQMLHIVSNMNWLSSSYLGGQKLEESLKDTVYSKSEVIVIMKKGFQNALDAINNLEPSKLNETVDFFAGPMHIRQILTLMNDHVTHHRGQAIVYARLKGIKPPRYRGW